MTKTALSPPRTIASTPPFRRYEADLIHLEGQLCAGAAMLIDGCGRIIDVGKEEEVPSPPGTVRRRYTGALLPDAVNAHSHAFQIMLRGSAECATDFHDWVGNYHVSAGRSRSSSYAFELGTANGGVVLGVPIGCLAPGYWADFVVVDTSDLSLLPHDDHNSEVLLNNVVHAMAARGAIRNVIVAGVEVVANQKLTRFDERALAREAGAWKLSANPT